MDSWAWYTFGSYSIDVYKAIYLYIWYGFDDLGWFQKPFLAIEKL